MYVFTGEVVPKTGVCLFVKVKGLNSSALGLLEY